MFVQYKNAVVNLDMCTHFVLNSTDICFNFNSGESESRIFTFDSEEEAELAFDDIYNHLFGNDRHVLSLEW